MTIEKAFWYIDSVSKYHEWLSSAATQQFYLKLGECSFSSTCSLHEVNLEGPTEHVSSENSAFW